MKCKNCGKEIDSDSKFCIFCGNLIEEKSKDNKKDTDKKVAKKEVEKNNNIGKDDKESKESLKKQLEEEKNKAKKLDSEIYNLENENKKLKRKNKNFGTALAIIGVALLIIIIIFSANLSVNRGNIRILKQDKEELDILRNQNESLEEENESLHMELNQLEENYKDLQVDYNALNSRYKNVLNQDNEENEESSYSYSDISEKNTFLNSVYNLLGKYDSAINHMNTYHKEGWIFNDPNDIALEETFLVKLQELSNQLKNFSYPSNFSSQRNNLVNISEEICHYQNLSIECMKNNDYENYLNYNNARNNSIDKLFNYYNSLVE